MPKTLGSAIKMYCRWIDGIRSRSIRYRTRNVMEKKTTDSRKIHLFSYNRTHPIYTPTPLLHCADVGLRIWFSTSFVSIRSSLVHFVKFSFNFRLGNVVQRNSMRRTEEKKTRWTIEFFVLTRRRQLMATSNVNHQFLMTTENVSGGLAQFF